MFQIPPTLDSDHRAERCGTRGERVPSLAFQPRRLFIGEKVNIQTSVVNGKTICQRAELMLSDVLKLGDILTSQTMKTQLII